MLTGLGNLFLVSTQVLTLIVECGRFKHILGVQLDKLQVIKSSRCRLSFLIARVEHFLFDRRPNRSRLRSCTPFEHRSFGDELIRCQRLLFSINLMELVTVHSGRLGWMLLALVPLSMTILYLLK